MSVSALLNELEAAGIRLVRDGDELLTHIHRGATIDPYRERIATHKPAVLTALHLRERIVAATSVERSLFDRSQYDRLWAEWYAHDSGEG